MKITIIGATGLVGSKVVDLAMEHPKIRSIEIFVRHPTEKTHPKLQERIVNFADLSQWKEEISGDVLISCLGTTFREAGSRKTQWEVDYTYQYEIARTAKRAGVSTLVLLSSIRANPESRFFYFRMKGELEEAVYKLDFDRLRIIRPGPFEGIREKPRKLEQIANRVLKTFLPSEGFYTVRPIAAEKVARAALESAVNGMGGGARLRIIEAEEIHAIEL